MGATYSSLPGFRERGVQIIGLAAALGYLARKCLAITFNLSLPTSPLLPRFDIPSPVRRFPNRAAPDGQPDQNTCDLESLDKPFRSTA